MVIAVIAILVGITLPALGGARETSRRVKYAYLRGLGTALQLYLDERKGALPLTRPLFDPLYDPDTAVPDTDPHDEVVVAQPEYPDADTGERVGVAGAVCQRVGLAAQVPIGREREGCGDELRAGVWRGNAWSYSYFAGDLILAAEFLTVPKSVLAEAVTKTYEQVRWKDLPVIFDFDYWHPLRAKPLIPRNAVYFGDWRADWATDLTKYQNQTLRVDQVWRDLVCDISRFGGFRLPGCP